MYIGFVVRHAAKKLLLGTSLVAAIGLATKAGRRAARIGLCAIAGAGKAAMDEIRTPNMR